MSAALLEPLHVAPLRLSVRGSFLDCPSRGRVRAAACGRCRYLQSSIGEAPRTILCGFPEPILASARRERGPSNLDGPLILDMDWPED